MPTTDSDLGLFCQFWYKNKRNSKDLGMSTVPARNFTYIVRNPLERKFNGELRDLVSEEYFFSRNLSKNIRAMLKEGFVDRLLPCHD